MCCSQSLVSCTCTPLLEALQLMLSGHLTCRSSSTLQQPFYKCTQQIVQQSEPSYLFYTWKTYENVSMIHLDIHLLAKMLPQAMHYRTFALANFTRKAKHARRFQKQAALRNLEAAKRGLDMACLAAHAKLVSNISAENRKNASRRQFKLVSRSNPVSCRQK